MQIGNDAVLHVPLWWGLSALFGGLSTIVGMTWWVFVTFYRKSEAAELERSLKTGIEDSSKRSDKRHDELGRRVEHVADTLGKRMDRMGDTVSRMSEDTAYIRGVLTHPPKVKNL